MKTGSEYSKPMTNIPPLATISKYGTLKQLCCERVVAGSVLAVNAKRSFPELRFSRFWMRLMA